MGRALLDAAVAFAGDVEIRLSVTETNAAARRLYERYGFAPTGHTEPLLERSQPTSFRFSRPLRVVTRGDSGARSRTDGLFPLGEDASESETKSRHSRLPWDGGYE